jgi:parallel beta-helix repeat protein
LYFKNYLLNIQNNQKMKKSFLLMSLMAFALASCSEEQNLAPQATEEASKTVTTEATLVSAVGSAAAGDVITISGTIKLTKTLALSKSGTSSSRITLQGGTLDGSGIAFPGRGVNLTGSYWNIKNLTVKNAPDNGIVVQTGGNNTISGVTTTGNQDTGIQIYNGAHDILVSSCTSTKNFDTANGGENADGFACKLSSGKNNKFDKCTATSNSDDGWDLYGNPYSVTITNCTASSNGAGGNGDGNGFKLGSSGQNLPHTVTYCNAVNNKKNGYDGNGNTGHITITGSTGSGNGQSLFSRIF